MNTKQFLIFGKVQGVGFRFFTWQQAQKIGLVGTVRNQDDGSVEVIAQGTEEQLIALKNWLQQGSKFAQVEKVLELDYSSHQFETFSVIS